MLASEIQQPSKNISITDTSAPSALVSTSLVSLTDPSTSPRTTSSKGNCLHKRLTTFRDYTSCVNCGVYLPKHGIKSFKPSKMDFSAFFPPKTIYDKMVKRQLKLEKSANSEYLAIRQNSVDSIFDLAERLKISLNSAQLGVILLDITMLRQPSLTKQVALYAPTCLLLAAKTIELDERIPFIPRLKKYANVSFDVSDFSAAELKVLEIVDWNPQFASVIEIMEHIMSQGVLFSNDEVEETITGFASKNSSPRGLKENFGNNLAVPREKRRVSGHSPAARDGSNKENTSGKQNNPLTVILGNLKYSGKSPSGSNSTKANFGKAQSSVLDGEGAFTLPTRCPVNERRIKAILEKIEANYAKLSKLVTKDSDFIQWEPKIVAASAIAFLRGSANLATKWKEELEAITSLKFDQISKCLELMTKKFESQFATPKSTSNTSTSLNPTPRMNESKLVKPLAIPNRSLAPNKEHKLNGYHQNFQRSNTSNYDTDMSSVSTSISYTDKRSIPISSAKNLSNGQQTTLTNPNNGLPEIVNRYKPTINHEKAQKALGPHNGSNATSASSSSSQCNSFGENCAPEGTAKSHKQSTSVDSFASAKQGNFKKI